MGKRKCGAVDKNRLWMVQQATGKRKPDAGHVQWTTGLVRGFQLPWATIIQIF